MIRVESSVVINRPADVVGPFLGEIERQTDWTDMTSSRKLTDGPVRPGTLAKAEIALGPVKLGWTWEVVAFDPRVGLTYRTVSKGPLGMDGTMDLTPEGSDRTRVHAVVFVRTRGLLRLLEPLIRGEVTRNEAAELDRLKVLLEGTTDAPSASPAVAQR